MKKFVVFLIVVFLLIFGFICFSNKEKNYELEYELKDFSISESYDKDNKIYVFNISNPDYAFTFVSEKKYTNARKIVRDVEIFEDDNNYCVELKIDDTTIMPQCYKDGQLVDPYISGWDKFVLEDNTTSEEYGNVSIYDNNYTYLLWNNYGLTDVISGENFNFLEQESYNNSLSYMMEDYILMADYDSTRTFSKFYIYNNSDKKIDEWEFEFDISFDSYFMGDVEDKIYLFDKKNIVQYEIDIDKKEISVVSTADGAIFYDNGWENLPKNQFAYTEKVMDNNYVYNYYLEDNHLYLSLVDSSNSMLVSNREIDAIIYQDNEQIFYLSDDSLYNYDIVQGEHLLASYFEWNFSYEDKIFIFN